MKLIKSKILLFGLAALVTMAGCSGTSGKNGATGATGPAGSTGPAGPTLPSVSWVSPTPGNGNTTLDVVIRAAFTKAMNPASISTTTFLVSTQGIPVTGTISYNSGSQTAYFDPSNTLASFAVYTVTLTTGVQDTNGNGLAQNYTWSFDTSASLTPEHLYVVNLVGNVSVYNNASVANGNIFPDRNISGASTGLMSPDGIWYDSSSDRLYISNQSSSSITVYNNAFTATGNIAPSRTISGASTSLSTPVGLWYDPASDELYAANSASNSITVYNNASTATGNFAPSRTITGANTNLNGPADVWLDSVSNTLFVANANGNNITVYSNANTINGNIAPSRTITGANTGINYPFKLWYDSSSDTLYVANYSSSSITVYNNASNINGNIAPSRTISGANTGLNGPIGLWYDPASDELYVTNFSGNSITVYNNASTINGNIAPSRTITGGNTGLSIPYYMWLDIGQ